MIRKLLLSAVALSAILLAAVGCNKTPTAQELAEKAVKDYLMTNLDDPKSYESVSFTQLDTIYTRFEDEAFADDFSTAKFKVKFYSDLKTDREYDRYMRDHPEVHIDDSISFYQAYLDRNREEYDQAEKAFVPAIDVMWLAHEYRANNKMGALIKSRVNFYFDEQMNITQVTPK